MPGRQGLLTHDVGLPGVVHPLVVQVHAVVFGLRDDVEGSVIGVDDVEALLDGVPRLGPSGAPEVHLHAFRLHRSSAFLGVETAPDTRCVAALHDVLQQAIGKLAVILCCAEELVGTYVHHIAAGEYRFLVTLRQQVFIEYLADERDGFRIGGIQHFTAALVVIHRSLVDEVGSHTGEGEGVAGGVKLRDDADVVSAGIGDEISKLGFGIGEVSGRQRGAVSALLL